MGRVSPVEQRWLSPRTSATLMDYLEGGFSSNAVVDPKGGGAGNCRLISLLTGIKSLLEGKFEWHASVAVAAHPLCHVNVVCAMDVQGAGLPGLQCASPTGRGPRNTSGMNDSPLLQWPLEPQLVFIPSLAVL